MQKINYKSYILTILFYFSLVTFSNSQINLGLLRRETFLKKVLKNDRVLNVSSCSLSEL